MTLHDISVLVRQGTPEWPGDTPWTCRWTWEMAQGASVNVSAVDASPHVGTHADAPLHVKPGAAGAHELPLAAFSGPAHMVDVSGYAAPIEFDTLGYEPLRDGARLLLRTGRTIAGGRFPEAWPALSTACAHALVERGMVLLGVDAPSVDTRESKSLEVHHVLFDAGACVLENLDLSQVSPGSYELSAFPLRWEGLDAAPVRAVLRDRAR